MARRDGEVAPGALRDPLQQHLERQDLDRGSPRQQRRELLRQLGLNVGELVGARGLRQRHEDRAGQPLGGGHVHRRAPGHAADELIDIETLGRIRGEQPWAQLRRQLLREVASLRWREPLGERRQGGACGTLGVLPLETRHSLHNRDEPRSVHRRRRQILPTPRSRAPASSVASRRARRIDSFSTSRIWASCAGATTVAGPTRAHGTKES